MAASFLKKATGMLEIITFIVKMEFVHSFDIQQILSCYHVQLGVMCLF